MSENPTKYNPVPQKADLKRLGISSADLARYTGYNPHYVWLVLSGRRHSRNVMAAADELLEMFGK
jgi:hypothetical protein